MGFKKSDAILINGKRFSPANLFSELNDYEWNGIGCSDLVENPFIGMKFRSIYEI
ncbi:hypothetical protein [Bartonella koehlerae]|uniref:hypothetical protein n=1 Tax=Bartonella koehlerae TaxID=92181 RepID=UPI003CC92C9D